MGAWPERKKLFVCFDGMCKTVLKFWCLEKTFCTTERCIHVMGFGTVMKVLRKVQKHFWSQTSAWLSWVADCRWAWYSLVISHQEHKAITADLSKVWNNRLLPVTSLRWHRDSRTGLTAEALFQSRCFCLSWLWNKCLTVRADSTLNLEAEALD